MSQSLSGSEFPTRSSIYPMLDPSSVGDARRSLSAQAATYGFAEDVQGRIAIVATEMATNLQKYGTDGVLIGNFHEFPDGGVLDLFAVDRGPGMDVERSLRDGFTTGATPGTGLGAIKRQADAFDIYSKPESGTVVFARFGATAFSLAYEAYDWAALSIPLGQESVCGDAWTVRTNPGGLKIMVADGLGHGPAAHEASDAARRMFNDKLNLSLDQVLQAQHLRLKSTRGAAIFCAELSPGRVTYSGVGNVRGLICGPARSRGLISQNGTAGIQIRSPRLTQEPWDGIGVFILHTDGLNSRASLANYPGIHTRHPGIIAAILWRDFSRGKDDACVVAVRRST